MKDLSTLLIANCVGREQVLPLNLKQYETISLN